MPSRGLQPNLPCFSAFALTRAATFRASTISCRAPSQGSAISASSAAAQWDKALTLLHDLEDPNAADLFCSNSAILACGRATRPAHNSVFVFRCFRAASCVEVAGPAVAAGSTHIRNHAAARCWARSRVALNCACSDISCNAVFLIVVG